MSSYKYVDGLFKPRIDGYDNKDEFYNVKATDDNVYVYTKKGKLLCVASVNYDSAVTIHSEDDYLAVQNYNKTINASRIAIYKNNKLIKNTALYGKIKKIIFGIEDVYFMKYVFSRADRSYYQLINDDGKVITPEWQVIQHETEGMEDRFYCENYREITDEEMKENIDIKEYLEKIGELEEVAIYNGRGERLRYISYEDEDIPKNGRIGITKNQEFNESLILYNPENGKRITQANEVIEHQNENEGMQL